MRVMERLCPQTWWQWAIYGVMAALLVLNVALANMQALDAAPRPHSHHRVTGSPTTPDTETTAGNPAHESQAGSSTRQ